MTEEEIKIVTDCLYDKTYTCPVCEMTFKQKTIRKGKTRLVDIGMDLDAHHEPVEPLFYDVIMCNSCGYTTIPSVFEYITEKQKKEVMYKISQHFKPRPAYDYYNLDTSLDRYRLAYLVAMTKGAKDGEKSFISMKIAWHYKRMNMPNKELQSLETAYAGFTNAYSSEKFPICGIDELTLQYIMAYMAKRLGKYDESMRLLGQVISSRTDNARLKDHCFNLKEMIRTETGSQ